MNSEEFIELAYDKYDGTDEMIPPLPPIVFTHGVFDTKANWSDIAEVIADRTVRVVYTTDLPNHGDSPKSIVLTAATFISDIERFITKIGEPVIIIAHSVGSIAAIDIALRKPNLVKKLILIDFSPVRYPSDTEVRIMSVVHAMRDALNAIPSGLSLLQAKEKVNKYLERTSLADTVRKMILPTLIQDKNGIKWKTKLDMVENGSVNVIFGQLFPFKGTYNGDVLIISGELSNYVREKDHDKIREVFPNVKFHCIKDCTHWIHIEKKEDLINALLTFLS